MAPAEIGLRSVPSDPAIVGGVPKVNIQGFDAVGRHTSTPQFQTPRSWNPRATFSLTRGAHFIKFGGEFLHVQTRINDLNATIGRMNFENRFTNRAVGRSAARSAVTARAHQLHRHGPGAGHAVLLRPGRLPSHVQADRQPRPPLRVRRRRRSRETTSLPTSIPQTGTMVFATDGGVYERALIHPDRNNFAPRIGFAYTPGRALGRSRGLRRVLHAHGASGPRRPARFQSALSRRQSPADGRDRRRRRRLRSAVSAGQRIPVRPARSQHARRRRSDAEGRIPTSGRRTSSSTTSACSTS